MQNQFKSIKTYSSTMTKIDWVRARMKIMGYNLNKSQCLDFVFSNFQKQLEKIKEEKNGRPE